MASFDLSLAAARTGVARRVYLAAGAMVIAFLATIAIVIQFSTREADKFALDADMRSTSLEFDRMTQQAISEHSEIAFWNAAVEALAAKGGENMDFVQEQIADWMIDGLGYEWAFTVAPDGKAGVAVIGDQILRNPGKLSIVEANADLTSSARRHFEAKRVRAGKGFLIPAGNVDVVRGLQATAIRTWDGMPGIAIAQVIVPETEDFAIKDGEDTVFIAFKPLTRQAISELGHRLGLSAPDVVPFVPSELPISHIVLPNDGEAPELAFRWHPHAPRPAIIRAVAPIAIGLCALICAVLFYIVTRHGRALRALAESEERTRHMAPHDALTGLPNRHQFDQALEKLIGRSDPVAIICIDLDRFKEVNDTFGHHAGDAVLRAVAQRFQGRIGDRGIVARIGGDEFAVLADGSSDPIVVGHLAERIVEVLSRPFVIGGQAAEIGASVGITLTSDGEVDADALIQQVDVALYHAKEEGRGRHSFFDPSLTQKLLERRRLEADLRRACIREEFEVFFQPVLDTQSREFIGAEALVRWNSAERGMVSPAVFIPIAEELGLVNTIGSMVLDRACHEAVSWPDHLMVAVNVSPVQMMGGRLATDIAQVLHRTGLAPHRLEIEITETALVADDELALRSLEEVRALGVKISLDDFGTGYSSLSYLHRFPIDRIKIDGSFVNKLPTDAGSASIVRAIAQLGASLNMQVTAEGIETDDQYSFVAEQGCGHMQGFLFNKPVDARSAAKLFASGSSSRSAA